MAEAFKANNGISIGPGISVEPYLYVEKTGFLAFGSGIDSSGYQINNQQSIKITTTGVISYSTYTNTPLTYPSGASYGFGKGMFAFGYDGSSTTLNYFAQVNTSGVLQTSTTTVDSTLQNRAGASYGPGFANAIFGFGCNPSTTTVGVNTTNKLSTTGVFSGEQSTVATARIALAAASYGSGYALFGFGYYTVGTTRTHTNISNRVSPNGDIIDETTYASGDVTPRSFLAAATYGTDKAIFFGGFGFATGGPRSAIKGATNLVNNQGVVESDSTTLNVPTALAQAVSYSFGNVIFYGGSPGTNGLQYSLFNNQAIPIFSTTITITQAMMQGAGVSYY